jgi:hypothetical protein
MMFYAAIYAGILVVIPLWLVLRAWRRYYTLNFNRSKDRFLARLALALLSLALGVLLVFVALANFGGSIGVIVINAVNEFLLSPWTIWLVNCLLCVSSLKIASLISRGTADATPLRRGIALAAIYLILTSLLAMGAAH